MSTNAMDMHRRHADAVRAAVPTEPEFDKAAGMLLERGYQ